jgi:DNA-directed RNA polymerase beta subunit
MKGRTFVIRAVSEGNPALLTEELSDKFARAELKGDDLACTEVYDDIHGLPENPELEEPMEFDTEFKRDFSYKHIFKTFKAPWKYSLGEVGREKLNKKFGFSNKVTSKQLTSVDVEAAANWLYRLRDGKESIDDIDHSQNRRVRQSGELIQSQFENGIARLKKFVKRKLRTPTFESFPFRDIKFESSSSSLGLEETSYGNRSDSNSRSATERGGFVKLTQAARLLSKKSCLFSRTNLIHESLCFCTVNKPRELPKWQLRIISKRTPFSRKKKNLPLFVSFFDRNKSQDGSLTKNKGELPLNSVKVKVSVQAPVNRTKLKYKEATPFKSDVNKNKFGGTFTKFPLQGVERSRGNPTIFVKSRTKPADLLKHNSGYTQNSLEKVRDREREGAAFTENSSLVNCQPSVSKASLYFDKSSDGVRIAKRSRKDFALKGKGKGTFKKVSSRVFKEASDLFSTTPINGALREFFGSNPLSQYMDQTNPLAEVTHKRRISSLGIGGVSRESASMSIRGIHPTHYGRICPIETPEGRNAGLVNSLAIYARINKHGFLETPYYKVRKGQVQEELGFSFYSARKETVDCLHLAPSDLQQSQANMLGTLPRRKLLALATEVGSSEVKPTFTSQPPLPSAFVDAGSLVPVRVADGLLDDFKKVRPYEVDCIGISPVQILSLATSLIPFLEHNDANRALMGSNMQRQAVPLMISERPIVGTGLETVIAAESGQVRQSSVSGLVSHVSANKIIIERLSNTAPYSNFCLFSKKNKKKNKSEEAQQAKSERAFKKIKKKSKNKKVSGLTGVQVQGCVSCGQKKDSDLLKGGKVLRSISFQSKAKVVSSAKLSTQASKNKSKDKFFRSQLGQTEFDRSNRVRLGLGKNKSKSEVWVCERTLFSEARSLHFRERETVLLPFIHSLRSFSRSNQETCLTDKPLVQEGDWIQKGDSLSDCSASEKGELAVGKNVLIAYLPWEGYNFEDAIVVSDRLNKEQIYSSIHIERYVCEAQDLQERFRSSSECFTSHLPGVDPTLIRHLDSFGFPKIGTILKEGDILAGKIKYFTSKPTNPYEKLLGDISGADRLSVKPSPLRVPKGVHEARVISHLVMKTFPTPLQIQSEFTSIFRPAGVTKMVQIFVAEKRGLQIGDKMSGRHGNKGIISTILPKQDMPYLPNGVPIDILLNPLGVPSRMNVGQIYECLLGLASTHLNQNFKITAFDEVHGVEASQSVVFLKLFKARLQSGQNWLFQTNFPGKTRLIDGRSGECFDQWVTVGRAYMLKLIHMVNEKIHARNTGPYALITQQPLRGRSSGGGQRFGEMEVWALEGYGAAYTLQELVTKKSDDFAGRKEIIDTILKGIRSETGNRFQVLQDSRLGHPEIFNTLLCELQALCLDVGVYALKKKSFQREYLGIVR